MELFLVRTSRSVVGIFDDIEDAVNECDKVWKGYKTLDTDFPEIVDVLEKGEFIYLVLDNGKHLPTYITKLELNKRYYNKDSVIDAVISNRDLMDQ